MTEPEHPDIQAATEAVAASTSRARRDAVRASARTGFLANLAARMAEAREANGFDGVLRRAYGGSDDR